MTIYITTINSEGEVLSMYMSGAVPSPGEGVNAEDPTTRIVWVGKDIGDQTGFIETKYYSDGEWLDRAPQPANYYNWASGAWVLNSVRLFKLIRRQRDELLFNCDWTQAADSPLTDAKKAEWALYRRALRAVPGDNPEATSIDDVAWPRTP